MGGSAGADGVQGFSQLRVLRAQHLGYPSLCIDQHDAGDITHTKGAEQGIVFVQGQGQVGVGGVLVVLQVFLGRPQAG
uniref:Uncharacterized protein n=1 Tax=biofilter metagenome TaxID=1070537 RepID=A0A193SBV5_9ZZZZ